MTIIIQVAYIKDMQRIQQIFIWGDNDQTRQYRVVGWDMLTRLEESGGLELRIL